MVDNSPHIGPPHQVKITVSGNRLTLEYDLFAMGLTISLLMVGVPCSEERLYVCSLSVVVYLTEVMNEELCEELLFAAPSISHVQAS
jgi:hypothetical protein